MSQDNCTISVALGSDNRTATVRLSGRSRVVVSTLLGVDCDASGEATKLYFNSLFHDHGGKTHYKGWEPSGCISTILTKVES